MPEPGSRRTALSEDLPLSKILTALAGVLMLMLSVKALDFVQWVIWPSAQDAVASAAKRRREQAWQMPLLQWRNRWWAWQLLAWCIATMSSPTFLIIGSLLLVNSSSDHPLFWWSLPAIVAAGNAVAILYINQRHHRDPFINRRSLARHHVLISTLTGATLFLLVGLLSGFLPVMAAPLSTAANTMYSSFPYALCSAGMALVFGTLSFPFAGTVHASVVFQAMDVADAQPLLAARRIP